MPIWIRILASWRFAKTLKEHNANVAQYKPLWEEADKKIPTVAIDFRCVEGTGPVREIARACYFASNRTCRNGIYWSIPSKNVGGIFYAFVFCLSARCNKSAFFVGNISANAFPQPPLAGRGKGCLIAMQKRRYRGAQPFDRNQFAPGCAHLQKNIRCRGYDSEDLISIGTVGLIKAVMTFNRIKVQLATYAARCIENEVLMSMRSSKSTGRYIFAGTGGERPATDEISLLDILRLGPDNVFDDVELRIQSQALLRPYIKMPN